MTQFASWLTVDAVGHCRISNFSIRIRFTIRRDGEREFLERDRTR